MTLYHSAPETDTLPVADEIIVTPWPSMLPVYQSDSTPPYGYDTVCDSTSIENHSAHHDKNMSDWQK